MRVFLLASLLVPVMLLLTMWQYGNAAWQAHLVPQEIPLRAHAEALTAGNISTRDVMEQINSPALPSLAAVQHDRIAATATYHRSGTDLISQYAAAIEDRVPSGAPVVVIVPLNGTPVFQDHASYRSAWIALEVLRRVAGRHRYLLLSEGYTGDPCVSGAEITAELLGLKEGLNKEYNITLLLEKEATTTYANMVRGTQLIKNTISEGEVYVVVAGMSSAGGESAWDDWARVDIGHAARAYMLGKSIWGSGSRVRGVGILPTTLLDPTISAYPDRYNLSTMVLASVGALALPRFERGDKRRPELPCARPFESSSTGGPEN